MFQLSHKWYCLTEMLSRLSSSKTGQAVARWLGSVWGITYVTERWGDAWRAERSPKELRARRVLRDRARYSPPGLAGAAGYSRVGGIRENGQLDCSDGF